MKNNTKPLNSVLLYVAGGILVFMVVGYAFDASIFTELFAYVNKLF